MIINYIKKIKLQLMEKEDLQLGFSKLQGLGNDYLYIDCLDKYRWLLTEGAYDLH